MITEVIVAGVAVIAVVRAHRPSAIIAAAAFPVVDGHIGAGRVIIFQHSDHHGEKITNPSLLQCFADSRMAIPLTEYLMGDMGMSDVFIGSGRIGFNAMTR